jgi:hypothetical protein
LGGSDAVQALLLAIAGASVDLELCEEAVRGLLPRDGVFGDLGLPDPQALHGTRKGAG